MEHPAARVAQPANNKAGLTRASGVPARRPLPTLASAVGMRIRTVSLATTRSDTCLPTPPASRAPCAGKFP